MERRGEGNRRRIESWGLKGTEQADLGHDRQKAEDTAGRRRRSWSNRQKQPAELRRIGRGQWAGYREDRRE